MGRQPASEDKGRRGSDATVRKKHASPLTVSRYRDMPWVMQTDAAAYLLRPPQPRTRGASLAERATTFGAASLGRLLRDHAPLGLRVCRAVHAARIGGAR